MRARGRRDNTPRFKNGVEGSYGIARFAEREAVDSNEPARSTCGCPTYDFKIAFEIVVAITQHCSFNTINENGLGRVVAFAQPLVARDTRNRAVILENARE